MTDTQPAALRLADTLDLAPENGIEPQTSEDAAAELRRLHTENTALQQGYAAARLEIESLQARIKTMAEEHADELMVAHLDGRVRAAQPAGAQQPTTQTAPASQGDALSDDAVRVPLDSLHADAAYLIGRLLEGSMPHARVIEIIRERIDAAKAAIRARAEQGYALVPVEPTPEMVDAAQEAYMPFGDMQLAIQLAIAAAPQPVAREPLIAEQYNILVEDLSEWSRHVEVDTAPRSLEEHIHQVFAIHGIKGGQHGAE